MIHWSTLDQLSGAQVYELFMLRQQVFMIEQECLYQDIDQLDQTALHCRYLNEQNRLIGYLRLIPQSSGQPLAIGRVAVRKKSRRRGIAQQMMASAIEYCAKEFSHRPVRLAAQSHLVDFYREFGFVETGSEYLEDDIPHQDMIRRA